jgi:hypothetical protein
LGLAPNLDLLSIQNYFIDTMQERWNIPLTEAKSLGESLRIINTKKQEGSLYDEELWYQGEEKYFNIFMGIVKDDIEWVQLTFRGAYIELKKGTLVTGTTSEFSGAAMDGTPSKLLNRDQNFNKPFLQVSIELLRPLEKDPKIFNCIKFFKAFDIKD